MSNARYVGLDVHKDSIVISVAESGNAEAMVLGSCRNDINAIIKQLKKLSPDVSLLRVCYEAGPTGFGLSRRLKKEGIDCMVVAPSLVPQKSGLRIKTDRRDSKKLAHYLRSGDLTQVWVPDEQTEALRDLERTRDDTTARVKQLMKHIEQFVEGHALQPLVKALMSFRGIQLLSATVIAAEIGDLRRFKTAGQFMAFLGLVPSESSSGNSVKRGSLTKTGNGHVRRILVEAAQHYRHCPVLSAALRKRQEGISKEVQDISWEAQQRL